MRIVCSIVLVLLVTNSIAQCDAMHGKVVINELCPFNSSIAQNSLGMYEDYVELFNNTPQAINLNGYFLSDRRGNRTKFEFPNVSIPANGFLIIWCDGIGDPNQSGLNAGFSFSSTDGEQVVFSNPDTVVVDFMKYGPTGENVSIGRFPNGTGPFTTMIPSFNSFNFNGDAFNVVINEYLASNSEMGADAFGEYDDWVELYNNSLSLINLNGYFLSDNSNTPGKFKFGNTSIGPNQYVIVWLDNQPEQGILHAPFGLSATGEELLLSNPDTLTIDYFRFGEQTQNVSEGRSPNGFGKITACMAPTFSAQNGGLVNTSSPLKDIAEIVLFPNPSREFVNINNPGTTISTLRIVDISGSTVKEMILDPGNNQLYIRDLSAGTYIIYAPFGRAKLIIQK
jgi:hypothetical protein